MIQMAAFKEKLDITEQGQQKMLAVVGIVVFCQSKSEEEQEE